MGVFLLLLNVAMVLCKKNKQKKTHQLYACKKCIIFSLMAQIDEWCIVSLSLQTQFEYV